jgi:hypothetical protein
MVFTKEVKFVIRNSVIVVKFKAVIGVVATMLAVTQCASK